MVIFHSYVSLPEGNWLAVVKSHWYMIRALSGSESQPSGARVKPSHQGLTIQGAHKRELFFLSSLTQVSGRYIYDYGI